MPRINLSQYQFKISDPYKAGHVMTELEANILNYHRADLIRKIVMKWVSEAEDVAEDGVLSVAELDRLIAVIAQFDSQYRFSVRTEPKVPAFDHHLLAVAMDEVAKHEPPHTIPNFAEKVVQAMHDLGNREKARKRLVTSIRSIY